MYAIQKQIPYGRKWYTKDFQAALHEEDLAANFARSGDIYQLKQGLEKAHEQEHNSSHRGQQESKRPIDNRSNDNDETANYSFHATGNFMKNNSANMSGGCKLCGKNVIHLDGRCDVYKSSGIHDSNHDNQANYAMDTRGKQRQVLFDGVQD